MKKLTFIATDLETTGLSPEIDTIIEVAAMKFDIIFENNQFRIENETERTMLINPLQPLSEEATLITHITNEMLIGKPSWSDVKENVKKFFEGDAIILGHNVFFDIAMFRSHGIDFSSHPVIDTFELSEIFSQDASSLNLGFLADHYNVAKNGQEHRALTDVKISANLFIKFLEQIRDLENEKKVIWNTF